jgi:hypothetical protein
MLVRVALGRQIKERQGWVDQAEPRRFLVSFDVESDSYAAAAGDAPTAGSSRAFSGFLSWRSGARCQAGLPPKG